MAAALALVVAGCSSDGADEADTPVCQAIAEVAELDAAATDALAGDWAEARTVLAENIAATDEIYRELVAADAGEVSRAADDLLAFDEAVLASGALDAASAEEFGATVSSIPGTAEAGAATAVLRDHLRDTCGVAQPD